MICDEEFFSIPHEAPGHQETFVTPLYRSGDGQPPVGQAPDRAFFALHSAQHVTVNQNYFSRQKSQDVNPLGIL